MAAPSTASPAEPAAILSLSYRLSRGSASCAWLTSPRCCLPLRALSLTRTPKGPGHRARRWPQPLQRAGLSHAPSALCGVVKLNAARRKGYVRGTRAVHTAERAHFTAAKLLAFVLEAVCKPIEADPRRWTPQPNLTEKIRIQRPQSFSPPRRARAWRTFNRQTAGTHSIVHLRSSAHARAQVHRIHRTCPQELVNPRPKRKVRTHELARTRQTCAHIPRWFRIDSAAAFVSAPLDLLRAHRCESARRRKT
eukprot:1892073-Pleurochrysis_carterae.AAC.2